MKLRNLDALKKPTEFKPRPSQEYFCFVAAKNPVSASVEEICRQAGIPHSTYYSWKRQDERFDDWREERTAYFRRPIHELLEFHAVKKLDNFSYWDAMARKFGYITNEAPSQPANPKDPITTPAEWRKLLEARIADEQAKAKAQTQ